MRDLTTSYLGLRLASPLVASAGPATGDLDTAARLVEAGASAVVLPSLFEEEILHDELELDRALAAGGPGAEATGYFPAVGSLVTTGDRYLHLIEAARARLGVPVIASLNAASAGGWTGWARRLESAGADAIELNVYRLCTDPDRAAADVEAEDLALIAAVRDTVSVPLAVKLSPYYSALAGFARRVRAAGADGLVLFNRFYQPDIDVDSLEVVPRVALSVSSDLRLPLRWIAILRPLLGPETSLAASSGVHTAADVAKALLAGADVAMMTSAVLRHGPGHLRGVHDDLLAWMEAHEYDSVTQLRGSVSHAATPDPAAFERANYVKTLHSWASN